MRALIVGRFQPFHNGHLAVVREALEEADEVVIGIAAATDSYQVDNPFTAGERNEMVTLAMREAGVDQFRVVNLPDINNYAVWPRYVVSLCPPFEVVVAHNPTTLELFQDLGYRTRRAKPFQRGDCSGTRIRELMARGGDWEALVPTAVAGYLGSIDAPGRLRRLGEGDAEGPA